MVIRRGTGQPVSDVENPACFLLCDGTVVKSVATRAHSQPRYILGQHLAIHQTRLEMFWRADVVVAVLLGKVHGMRHRQPIRNERPGKRTFRTSVWCFTTCGVDTQGESPPIPPRLLAELCPFQFRDVRCLAILA